jgi:hypothetical protein
MANFTLNTDHDLDLVDGNLVLVSDLAQRVDCRIRTFLGEHWLNPEIGVGYFDDFLVKNPDKTRCSQLIGDAVRSVSGVSAVDDVTVTFDAGLAKLSIAFSVTGTDDVQVTGTSEVL